MKAKYNLVIVTIVVALAVTVLAAEQYSTKGSQWGVIHLKAQGEVVAEVRLLKDCDIAAIRGADTKSRTLQINFKQQGALPITVNADDFEIISSPNWRPTSQ
jgi:hypothetical protein